MYFCSFLLMRQKFSNLTSFFLILVYFQMFADLHHLHQFMSLDQGGAITGDSVTGGTAATNANIYFGALHIDNTNVKEDWLDDDQVSAMNTGGNGPVTRNEGMYNNYTSVQTFWSDTTLMDNLRGGDATGVATPGAQEVSFNSNGGVGFGNTTHTYSTDSFY